MNGFPDCDDMGLAKEHKLQQEIDRENRDDLMNRDAEIRIAMCELCGFTVDDVERDDNGVVKRIWVSYPASWTGTPTQPWPPDFLKDLNAIFAAYRHVGLTDPKNLDLRVKWVANLRLVVGRRCPKNKVGAPLISDIDLLTSDDPIEHCEALLRTVKKWNTKWEIL
jgi:hypothetical protein